MLIGPLRVFTMLQVPVASAVVDGQLALNRCRWHQSGKDIAAGDDMGRIHVYDVGDVSSWHKNESNLWEGADFTGI